MNPEKSFELNKIAQTILNELLKFASPIHKTNVAFKNAAYSQHVDEIAYALMQGELGLTIAFFASQGDKLMQIAVKIGCRIDEPKYFGKIKEIRVDFKRGTVDAQKISMLWYHFWNATLEQKARSDVVVSLQFANEL